MNEIFKKYIKNSVKEVGKEIYIKWMKGKGSERDKQNKWKATQQYRKWRGREREDRDGDKNKQRNTDTEKNGKWDKEKWQRISKYKRKRQTGKERETQIDKIINRGDWW